MSSLSSASKREMYFSISFELIDTLSEVKVLENQFVVDIL